MLVWGVEPSLTEEFTSTDTMIKAAMQLASKKGVVTPGDNVVIVSGALDAGQTDFLRVVTMNLPS
jgi:pyruvate kinase